MDKYFQSNSILKNFYTKLLSEADAKGIFHDPPEEA
jgi:hypothetical protein